MKGRTCTEQEERPKICGNTLGTCSSHQKESANISLKHSPPTYHLPSSTTAGRTNSCLTSSRFLFFSPQLRTAPDVAHPPPPAALHPLQVLADLPQRIGSGGPTHHLLEAEGSEVDLIAPCLGHVRDTNTGMVELNDVGPLNFEEVIVLMQLDGQIFAGNGKTNNTGRLQHGLACTWRCLFGFVWRLRGLGDFMHMLKALRIRRSRHCER